MLSSYGVSATWAVLTSLWVGQALGCFSSFELWLCLFGKLSSQARPVELNVLFPVVRCLSFHNTKHLGAMSTSSRPYRLHLCPLSFIPQDLLYLPGEGSSFCGSRAISSPMLSNSLPLAEVLSGLALAFFPLPSSCQYRMGADQQLLCFSGPCFRLCFFSSFWFYIALSYFDDSSWYLSYFCNSYFMRVL